MKEEFGKNLKKHLDESNISIQNFQKCRVYQSKL